jgi:hypothetical protein
MGVESERMPDGVNALLISNSSWEQNPADTGGICSISPPAAYGVTFFCTGEASNIQMTSVRSP